MGLKKRDNDIQKLTNELKVLNEELSKLRNDFSALEKSRDETGELLRALNDNISDAVVIVDWEGNLLFANKAAYNLIEEDPAKEFKGRNVFEFLSPSDHEKAVQNLSVVRNGRSELKNVYLIHSEKGQEYWVEVSGKRITFHGTDADLVTITDITGRVKTEDELKKKQARLDSLFSAVPTGIGVEAHNILIDVNDRICEMTGYSREEILGKSSSVFYPCHDDFLFVQAEKQRLLMTTSICSLETKWKRKDGAITDIFLGFALLDPGDPEAGVTFTALDISERMNLDRILKDSEERYRRITSAITGYIYTVTMVNGRPVGTVHSSACEAVTGYSPAEFESDPYLWYTMIYEPDREEVIAHIEKVLSNQEVEPIEHCIVHRDGSLRWIRNTPVIHRDETGTITSYDGVITDITKRKLAEEALRESELRFRALHEASFGGIGIHDKGVILDCNQGLSDITGYSIDELIGMNGLSLIAPDWRDHVLQNIVSGYDKTYDVEGLRKDGTIYALEIRGKDMPYRGRTVRVTEFRDITDRKMSEDALRDSEERLRNIIENSTNAFYTHTTDNRLTYVSPRIKDILGYSDGEVLRRWQKLPSDSPVNREASEATLKAIRTGRTQPAHELELIAKDGRKVWVEVNESPVVSDGKTIMIVGSFQDITERKRAQEELYKSERRFKGIADNLPGVVYQFYARENGEIGLYYASDRAKEFLGREGSLDDFFQRFRERVAPEYRRDFESSIQEAVRSRSRWDFEFRFIPDNGREMYIRGLAQPEETREELIFSGIFLDVTDRKVAELALRRNEERFRSLIQESSDIIVIMNPQGLIVYETPSVSRILGYEPGYLIGKAPDTFIHTEDLDVMIHDLAEVYENRNEGIPTELRFRKADGDWVQLEAIGKNLLDYPGISGIVITARDITDRKKAEAEKIEMERRFQHAQKLESLGVLAGGIAHDFNNLLMAILGNLDLSLVDIPQGSKSHHFITQACMAARRAADLTNQMLAYSGKGRFDLKTFDLNDLVEEMSRLLKVSISKNVTLTLRLERSIPSMTADPAQIQQIIMNLIVNASEAISDRTGVVTLTTGVQDCDGAFLETSRIKEKQQPGMYLFVKVEDTGCGMDEHTMERLFDPFFSTKFTGRGLGMAAVQGIVRGHKGAVMVESEPGIGTSIQVLFPVLEANARSGDLSRDEEPPMPDDLPSPVESLSSGTILIVDDEKMVLDLCSSMVERLGYRVFTTSDGKEALKVYRKHSREIDCVILDLTMPRMDGMTAFEELKRVRKGVKVLISSGYSKEEVAQRFEGKEPAGFIKKPFEFSVLRRELSRILGKK